jgi:uncharacterized protein (TIGR02996 family)
VSEDDAFVARLRANPDDETARLVYSDFLDDRDDPRGAYLRSEAAWVALQPAHEQYRPLYRELSRRAAALDLTWLVGASRVAHLVRRECAPGPSYTYTIAPEPDLRPERGVLRKLYAEVFGADAVEARFCLPVDFLAFMALYGGANNSTTRYYSTQGLIIANHTNLNGYRPTQPAPERWSDEEVAERPTNPEMWIEFGGVGDNVFHFVCADLGSPLFGVTAEGEDYHPWMAGIEPLIYRGRNTLHFLGGYLPTERSDLAWPRVPHSEWATH